MSQVLTFSSLKGGVGKTTCTILFAETLQAAGRRLLLVDMDPQHSLTTYMRATGDVDGCDRNIFSHLASRTGSRSKSAGSTDRSALLEGSLELSRLATDPPRGRTLKRMINRMAEITRLGGYDYVLIDTSPTVSALSRLTLPVTDHLFVITTPEVWSVRAVNLHLESLETQIRQVGSNMTDVCVVTNAYDSSRRGDQVVREAMRTVFPEYLVDPPIPYSKAVPNFVLNHRDVARFMEPVRAAVHKLVSSKLGEST